MGEEITTRTEFGNHLKEDFRKVHNIWPHVPYFVWSVSTLSWTYDGAWHTATAAGPTPSADKQIVVILGILRAASNTIYVYTRKYGSTEDWEGVLETDYIGGMIIQACDSNGQYEYKTTTNAGITVKQLGYMAFPA